VRLFFVCARRSRYALRARRPQLFPGNESMQPAHRKAIPCAKVNRRAAADKKPRPWGSG